MLKIYGMPVSNNVNKVRYTANAVGLDYELVPVNLMEGEQRSEEFLKLNPVGKVPVIQDEKITMFESMAIARYLVNKTNSDLYPQDLKQRAVIDQWIDFCNIHVQGMLTRVLFNRLIAPMVGAEVDENSLKFGLQMLDQYLPVLDNQLGVSTYLAGDNLTLADINLVAILDPAQAAGVDISGYQNLNKWFKNIKQQDFYQKCHSDYNEVLASMQQ